MDELNYIGQLFRDGIKGHTIEPSDKVWANIQKNIGSSPAIKPKAKFAKYFISGAAIVSFIVASVAVAYYLTSTPSNVNSLENKSAVAPQKVSNTENANKTEVIANKAETSNNIVANERANKENTLKSNTIQNKVSTPAFTNVIAKNTSPVVTTQSFLANNTEKTVLQHNSNQPNKELTTPTVFKTDFEENPKTTPTLEISNDTTICFGETVTLKAKGGTAILWSNGASTDEITVTALNEEQTIAYMAVVKTLTGDTTINIKVKVVDCHPYEQPNAFTPNGDGKNDLFMPNVPSNCSDYSLMIFNRSGIKVFESKVKEKGWDGKFNNQEQKEGAYFYILQYKKTNGEIKTIRGTIVLLPQS